MSSESWLRPVGGRVAVAKQALERMEHYRQHDPKSPESGGILLGRMLAGCDDVVIDFVTSPSSSDYRTRHRYTRQAEPAQTIIKHVWSHTQGTCNYLGEWHTHPAPVANPSDFDLVSWSRHTKRVQCGQGFLLFALVAVHEIALWEYNATWQNVVRLVSSRYSVA
jgi:integrative and conjugative element protein (TIGR02256 family)